MTPTLTDIPADSTVRTRPGQIALFLQLLNGNREAVDWCILHDRYAHQLDDLVDKDKPCDPSDFALTAMEIYSHPFFQKNTAALKAVMRLSHSTWLDANDWSTSPKDWQRTDADVLRHAGADVIRVVADLCGGWQAMRDISPVLRILAYEDHHDKDGNPI